MLIATILCDKSLNGLSHHNLDIHVLLFGIMPPEMPDTSTSLPSTVMEMTPFSTWFGFLTVTW